MYTFKTPDVALATTLRLFKHEFSGLEIVPGSEGVKGRPMAQYVYDVPDDKLKQFELVVQRYNDKKAEVEPQSFALEFRACRDSLFDFLSKARNSRFS